MKNKTHILLREYNKIVKIDNFKEYVTIFIIQYTYQDKIYNININRGYFNKYAGTYKDIFKTIRSNRILANRIFLNVAYRYLRRYFPEELI